MGWVVDRDYGDEGRPQPPPRLTKGQARVLLNTARVTFLDRHPSLASMRIRALTHLERSFTRLDNAETRYSDRVPKTATGEANEWNECRKAAEEVVRAGRAYLALLMEEEE